MTPAVRAYLERKAKSASELALRPRCLKCKKPEVTCYCADLRPIISEPRVLILMHPLEFKHPIGTGRLAHHCLANSELWVGADFARSGQLQALLANPRVAPTLLYPNAGSIDLSRVAVPERRAFLSDEKENVLIILDATWHLAKKMLHRTPALQTIPRICFTPRERSRFVVRRQPHAQCLSTIEAIHEVLDLIHTPPDEKAPPHRYLLDMFSNMLATQLAYNNQRRPSRHQIAYAKRKAKRQLAAAQSRSENLKSL